VQRHTVKDLPTHVDFMRLRRTSEINLYIPVEFLNEDTCPGLKKGGVLSLVRPEVELVVTAGDIPEKITVDLADLEVGDVITISQSNCPKAPKQPSTVTLCSPISQRHRVCDQRTMKLRTMRKRLKSKPRHKPRPSGHCKTNETPPEMVGFLHLPPQMRANLFQPTGPHVKLIP
jgi:hypothetical protein